jgi:ribosomal protein S12 methylthiotransferase
MGQLKVTILRLNESENSDASVVVINTCGFIDNAKQESINTILEYARAKEKGLVEKVYVTGCLSERYKPELKKEIPNIDEYFGTHDLPRLLKTLGADYKHELIGERLLTTPVHYAYFKISEDVIVMLVLCYSNAGSQFQFQRKSLLNRQPCKNERKSYTNCAGFELLRA